MLTQIEKATEVRERRKRVMLVMRRGLTSFQDICVYVNHPRSAKPISSRAIRQMLDSLVAEGTLLCGRSEGGRALDLFRMRIDVCRGCGCEEGNACVDEDGIPCHWAQPEICSQCDRRGINPHRER